MEEAEREKDEHLENICSVLRISLTSAVLGYHSATNRCAHLEVRTEAQDLRDMPKASASPWCAGFGPSLKGPYMGSRVTGKGRGSTGLGTRNPWTVLTSLLTFIYKTLGIFSELLHPYV